MGRIDLSTDVRGALRRRSAPRSLRRGFLLNAHRFNDPHWSSVSALLHMDGADASTTFTDVKGVTFTANGNAQIDTAQSLYGGASGLFDGNGDFLSAADNAAHQIQASDFTINAAIRLAGYPAAAAEILAKTGTATSTQSYIFYVSPAGVLVFGWSSTGSNAGFSYLQSAASAISLNTWYQLEICRIGTSAYMFIGGVLVSGPATMNNFYNSAGGLTIGATSMTSYRYYFNGHIDEVRLTKGVGRHSATHTPYAGAFPSA